MRFLAFAVALSVSSVSSVVVVAQSPSEVLDHATAAYAQMKTAHVTFTQFVKNPLTNADVASKGEMYQKLPGHYDVTFTQPAGDRIVSDGRVVWIYLPSTNPGQVMKLGVGEGGQARVPDFTTWLLDAPKSRFTIAGGGAATVSGKATHVLLLTPKGAGVPFVSARLWVDDADGIVRQFETADENGSTRRVRVESIEMNVPVSASAFTFTVPVGVKVYEPGASGT